MLGIGVDDVEDLLGAEAGDELLGAAGADVLDPAQVAAERGGVLGRQRPRLRHLDLAAVAAVVDPVADDPDPLALLEVDEGADERHGAAVGTGGVEHGPAGLLVGIPDVADRHLVVKAHAPTLDARAGVRARMCRSWHTRHPEAGQLPLLVTVPLPWTWPPPVLVTAPHLPHARCEPRRS